jgi:hypothetical protein
VAGNCSWQLRPASVSINYGRQLWSATLVSICVHQLWPSTLASSCVHQLWPASVAGNFGQQLCPSTMANNYGRHLWPATVASTLAHHFRPSTEAGNGSWQLLPVIVSIKQLSATLIIICVYQLWQKTLGSNSQCQSTLAINFGQQL